MTVTELTSTADYKQAYPLISELVDHLNEDEYLDLLTEMRKEGYRLFSFTLEGEIMSLAGVSIRTDFFNGRHLWVHDVVTSRHVRSKGYGKQITAYLEDFAQKEKCKKIVLYSGMSRTAAHHFWENHMKYEKRGIVFKKEIT